MPVPPFPHRRSAFHLRVAHLALPVLFAISTACAGRDGAVRSASDAASASVGQGVDTLAGVGVRGDASTASLVGRLVDDVVRDSALQASWALEPLERHLGIVHATIGDAHYLLADSLVGYDGPRARWLIRQAQRVSTPGPGEAWVTSCVISGTDARDGTIVARVTLTPDDSLPTPHDAWRLDPAAWRFTPFPPASLSCFNEGGDN